MADASEACHATSKQAGRQAGKQAGRQAGRQASKQASREIMRKYRGVKQFGRCFNCLSHYKGLRPKKPTKILEGTICVAYISL